VHAHGSDRLRVREDGAIVLSSRLVKVGWQGRVAKTLTTAEHPGTAVMWDDECYEVLEVEALQQGVRYTLGPWGDNHTMRFSETYDDDSEARREADFRSVAARVKGRRAALTFAFLTGHLPASVQKQIGDETGTSAPLLTIISAIVELLPGILCLNAIVSAKMAGTTANIPFPIFLLSIYMTVDAIVRFAAGFLNGRPMGSVFGLIGYSIYYATSKKRAQRIAPLSAAQGEGTFRIELDADAKLRGSLHMFEPLFTLLSPVEQQRIAERYGYDHRHTASAIAWGILVFSTIGVVTSIKTLNVTPRLSAVLSLLTAGYLAVEQIVRLTQLNQRPIGSILGFAARPFARKFIA
jgi:hypothetical protein